MKTPLQNGLTGYDIFKRVTSMQRPREIIRVAVENGHNFLISVELNTIARWIKLRFSSSLTIIIRPLDLIVDGKEIKDEELANYIDWEH